MNLELSHMHKKLKIFFSVCVILLLAIWNCLPYYCQFSNVVRFSVFHNPAKLSNFLPYEKCIKFPFCFPICLKIFLT